MGGRLSFGAIQSRFPTNHQSGDTSGESTRCLSRSRDRALVASRRKQPPAPPLLLFLLSSSKPELGACFLACGRPSIQAMHLIGMHALPPLGGDVGIVELVGCRGGWGACVAGSIGRPAEGSPAASSPADLRDCSRRQVQVLLSRPSTVALLATTQASHSSRPIRALDNDWPHHAAVSTHACVSVDSILRPPGPPAAWAGCPGFLARARRRPPSCCPNPLIGSPVAPPHTDRQGPPFHRCGPP